MIPINHYYSGPEMPKQKCLEIMDQFPGGSVDLKKNDNNGIALITFNNIEKKNAFSGSMIKQFHDRIGELESWKNGKGVILMGKDGHFSTGGDLNVVRVSGTPENGFAMATLFLDISSRLERLPMFVVALIEGYALGGGSEVAMASDFRLMTPTSVIGFVQMKLGIVPMWGGFTKLAHKIGTQRALEVVSRAEPIKSNKALEIGLIDAILPGNNPIKEAEQWLLSHLHDNDQANIGAIKQMVLNIKNMSYEQALSEERRLAAPFWGCEAQLKYLNEFFKKKNKKENTNE